MFYHFEAENKQIHSSLFFCCQPSHVAAATVLNKHSDMSIKFKWSSGLKELSTLPQTLCNL